MRVLLGRDAQVFLHVAQTQSLSKAARQLSVTPASLSIAMSRLEKRLATRLFDRDVQGIRLTAQGLALYETLAKFSSDLQDRVREAINPDALPQLRIGAGYDDQERYLMPALRQLKKNLPPFRLFCRPSVELYRAVEDGRLDFAWVAWPNEPRGSLEAIRVRNQTGGIVGLTKVFGHLKGTKSRRNLAGYPMVFIPRDPLPDWASSLDDSPTGYVVRDHAQVRSLVLAGEALGDLEYDLFTKSELKKLTIVMNDVDEDPATYVVYRKTLSNHIRVPMETLLKTYSALVERRRLGKD